MTRSFIEDRIDGCEVCTTRTHGAPRFGLHKVVHALQSKFSLLLCYNLQVKG